MRALPRPTAPTLGDIVAGLSVVLALIPQGLAYAELAGMPSRYGLVAGTIPPIAAALFVSSPYLQTGPTALSSLLVAGALAHIAIPGTADYIEAAAMLALMVGVIRIAFGLLRMGISAYLVSQPVLVGFTTSAAILIIGSQLPNIVGAGSDRDRVLFRAYDVLTHPDGWNWEAIAVAGFTYGLIVLLRKVHRVFPSVLVGVGATWLAAEMLDLEVARVGSFESGWIELHTSFPLGEFSHLLVPAFVIALIGFAEPASIARTFAAAERKPWSANREFVSQGVANVAAAFSGGYPVGGSFGRSGLNYRAGADTAWSGAITGMAMLALLPFAGVFETIPKAALAAVVVSAVSSLLDFPRLFAVARRSLPQFATALATMVGTMLFDPRIDRGIILGVVLAVVVHLWRELPIHIDHSYQAPTLSVAPRGVLWFGSVNRMVEVALQIVADHPEATNLEIDLSGVGRLDTTAAGELGEFAREVRESGMKVEFVGVPPHAQRLRAALDEPLGDGGD